MKVRDILFGQAIRFVQSRSSGDGEIYGGKLARAFEDRYGFLQSPRTVAEFDLKKGITFQHGYFQNRLVIDKFQMFENGILANCKSDTDNCVTFLQDVCDWAKSEAGVIFSDSKSEPELYQSHLEVETNAQIEDAFQDYSKIGVAITAMLRSYKQTVPEMLLAGIFFSPRITSESSNELPFKFERRAIRPFNPNLYYSSAPLKTKDHIKVLSALEKLLGSRRQ